MSVAGEDRPGVLATVKKRRWILVLVVVLSILAALPFALSTPSEYESSTQVLIPASDPVSINGNDVSRIPVQLAAWAKAGLAQNVSRSLGDRGAGLRSVTAVQLREQDLWLVTALANSASVAQQGVSAGANALIDRSNALAEGMIEDLSSEGTTKLTELNRTIASLSFRFHALQQQEQALSRKIVQLRKSGAPSQLSAATTQLQALREDRQRIGAELSLEKGERSAYPALIQSAVGNFEQRKAASSLIAPAPLGTRSAPARLATTIGLAVLAGLVVGLLLALWIERRSDRRARPRDASVHPVAPNETQERLNRPALQRSERRDA